jgi:hypothetical protein
MNAIDRGAGLVEQRPAGGAPRDPQAEYVDVRHRIHRLVGCLIERGSTVAVVSKGDQELVRLGSGQGWHFPRTTDGRYAGHHPADGADAIAHLERLRQEGADYFLLPSTYFWWLDHYRELAQHLRSRHRLVADCPDTCLIYDLRRGPAATRPLLGKPHASGESSTNGQPMQDPLVPAIRTLLDSLLPEDEPVFVLSEGNDELLGLGRTARHFPHDRRGRHRSIDAVGAGGIAAQLAGAQANGVRYLVVPNTAPQGEERSGALRELVRERGREVAFREGICAIYELEHAQRARTGQAARGLRRLFRPSRGRSDD